jgi:ribosomal protein S1
MVEIGSVIRAKVTRVEPFGIYLDHEGQTVCVLAPDIAWHDTRKLLERAQIGEEYDVRVLRYNYRDRIIVGSIRLLHPEENPYRELSLLAPGELLHGKVTCAAGGELTVVLPNGAWGHLPQRLLPHEVKVGDDVNVEISALDVYEGRLRLAPARPASQSSNGPAQKTSRAKGVEPTP